MPRGLKKLSSSAVAMSLAAATLVAPAFVGAPALAVETPNSYCGEGISTRSSTVYDPIVEQFDNGDCVITFRGGSKALNSYDYRWTPAPGLSDIRILAVGGGGAGGAGGGGGGGAGQFVEVPSYNLAAGEIEISIGRGGAAGSSRGQEGGDSVIDIPGTNTDLIAIGGGGGGASSSKAYMYGNPGGSGGGNGKQAGIGLRPYSGSALGPANSLVSTAYYFGNDGDHGYKWYKDTEGWDGAPAGWWTAEGSKEMHLGGGGGGAGSAGTPIAAGEGKTSDITGTDVIYAAGGGGGIGKGTDISNPGQYRMLGGSGIGGNGGAGNARATDGLDGTGSGGGGENYYKTGGPGDGGDGVVIIRYSWYLTPPTITSVVQDGDTMRLSYDVPYLIDGKSISSVEYTTDDGTSWRTLANTSGSAVISALSNGSALGSSGSSVTFKLRATESEGDVSELSESGTGNFYERLEVLRLDATNPLSAPPQGSSGELSGTWYDLSGNDYHFLPYATTNSYPTVYSDAYARAYGLVDKSASGVAYPWSLHNWDIGFSIHAAYDFGPTVRLGEAIVGLDGNSTENRAAYLEFTRVGTTNDLQVLIGEDITVRDRQFRPFYEWACRSELNADGESAIRQGLHSYSVVVSAADNDCEFFVDGESFGGAVVVDSSAVFDDGTPVKFGNSDDPQYRSTFNEGTFTTPSLGFGSRLSSTGKQNARGRIQSLVIYNYPREIPECVPVNLGEAQGTSIVRDGYIYETLEFRTLGACDWTPPAGLTEAEVLVVGAGGSGSATGGGIGGSVNHSATVAISGSTRINIGSGGSAGTAGGSTSFGDMSAAGGAAGGAAGEAGGAGTSLSISGSSVTYGADGVDRATGLTAYRNVDSGTGAGGKGGVALDGASGIVVVSYVSGAQISFEANGASGTMAGQDIRVGVPTTLNSNTFEGRAGSTFIEWNTAADGSGTSYSDGQLVTLDGPITLYAQFTPVGITVQFDITGGVEPYLPEQYAVADEEFNLNASTAVYRYPGKVFSHWNTERDGSGTSYEDEALVTFSDDTVLYVQWKPETYEVQILPGLGSGEPIILEKVYGKTLSLPHYSTLQTLFSKPGYDIRGLRQVESGADNNTYTSWQMNSPATFYPYYMGKMISVKYYLGGGALTSGRVLNSYVYDTSTYHTLNSARFQGKDVEWYSDYQLTQRVGAPGDQIQPAESISLYAKWIEPTYTVNFNSVGLDTVTVQQVGIGKIDYPAPTRDGYTFLYWYSDPDFTTLVSRDSITNTFLVKSDMELYAKWLPDSYSVKVFPKGADEGTSGPGTYEWQTGDNPIVLPSPTKVDHTFDGWYESTDYGVTKTRVGSGGDNYTPTANSYLLAEWTMVPGSGTVTFNYNGADGGNSVSSSTYEDGGDPIILPTPTRTGYDFTGWFSGEVVANAVGRPGGSELRVSSDRDLYAGWTAKTYQVSFDYQGATQSSGTSASYTYDGAPIVLPSPEKTGYEFAGWFVGSTSGTSAGAAGAAFTPSQDGVTLVAKWNPGTFLLVFEYNGATSGNATSSVEFSMGSDPITLPTPQRTGYSFEGWHTDSSLVSSKLISGSQYSPTADATIYAKWTAATFGVTYRDDNKTSGSAPVDAIRRVINRDVIVSPNDGNLRRSGYDLVGWTEASDGTGTVYVAGDRITITGSDIVLYPKWSAKTLTIAFSLNGGTGTANDVSYTTGDASAASLPTGVTKTGYDLAGWSTSYSASDIVSSYRPTDDVTLIAIWTAKSIDYSFNDGIVTYGGAPAFPSGGTSTYGSTVTLPSIASSVTDGGTAYEFAGWSDGTSVHQAGATYRFNSESDVTFTAQWAKLYQVTYALAGGTLAGGEFTYDAQCTGVENTCTDGQEISLNAAPSRDGYTFTGWKPQSGTAIAAGGAATISGTSYIFVAQWTADDYTFTFDVDGGSASPASITANINDSVSLPSPGTKSGHTFAGWSDGSDTYGVGADYVVGSSDQTLTATWTADVYTVSFDWQGGSKASGSSVLEDSFTFGAGIMPLPDGSNYERDGYVFMGWSETAGGTTPVSGYSPASSTTLYAIWQLGDFSIDFDSQGGNSISAVAVNLGDPITLPTPVRAKFTFLGWFDAATGGNKIGSAGVSWVTDQSTTLYARWIQDSLYGVDLAQLTDPVSRTIGDSEISFSISRGGTTAAVTIPAGSLPNGAVVSARVYKSLTRHKQKLPGEENHSFALLLSWIVGSGSSATVPDAGDTSVAGITNSAPISVVISNSAIKSGAKAHQIIADEVDDTKLATASSDGSVTVLVTVDPEIVVTQAAPEAPANVAGTAGDSSVTVTWDAPANGGSEIISYTVTTSPGGATCESTTTSCIVTGLTNGEGYTFTVTATNAYGTSADSSPSSTVTLPTISYDVTFDSNGGTAVSAGSFEAGQNLLAPAAPTRTGYTFVGWSTLRNDSSTAVSLPYVPSENADFTLYALWTIKLEVVFDAGDGSGPSPSAFTSGGSIDEPAEPTRGGYRFVGWSSAPDVADRQVSFPYTPGVEESVTLYALWTEIFDVSFDSLGGTSVTGATFVEGEAFDAPSAPARDGYTFQGWSTLENVSSTQVSFPYTSPILTDITLYAIWLPDEYVIFVDSDGGIGASSVFTYERGGDPILLPDVTKANYTFAGWFTDAELTVSAGVAGDPYTPSADGNLYAKWTGNTYTATYNYTDGSTDTASYTSGGTPIELPTPTKADSYFLGWYSDAEFLNFVGAAGADFVLTDDMVDDTGNLDLYPKWKVSSFVVAYSYDGADGPSTRSVVFTPGDSALTLPTPTNTGYSFAGWYSDEGLTSLVGDAGDAYTPTQAGTLFAKWTALQFTITYHYDGATTGADTSSDTYQTGDSAITLPTPGKDHYTFAGWYEDSNLIAKSANTLKPMADLDLYAKWTPNTYTISFDLDGGEFEGAAETSYVTGGIPVALVAPVKVGYTFGGWYSDSGLNTLVGGDGDTYAPTADGSLYAEWTMDTYTVNFDYNGGQDGSSNTSGTATYDVESAALTLPSITRVGYVFAGWYTDVLLRTPVVLNEQSEYEPTEDGSLFAKWNPLTYRVVYHTDDSTAGSGPYDSVQYVSGESVTIQPNTGALERTGYLLAGWTQESDGTGDLLTPGDQITVGSATIDLYPKWQGETYTIAYNLNGGSGSPSDTEYVNGDDAPALPSSGLTRDGYDFAGWSTTAGGTTPVADYKPQSDVTVYAIWTVQGVTYSFDAGAVTYPETPTLAFPSDGTSTYGSTLTLPAIDSSISDGGTAYEFVGWSDGDSTYEAGETYRFSTQDVSFSAEWAKLYQVTYALAGGNLAEGEFTYDAECTGTDDTCTNGQAINLNAAPSRDGYTFDGWKPQSGTVIAAGGAATVSGTSYIFVAQWTAIDYTFSFDVDGGDATPADVIANINETVTLPSPGNKSGYTFAGWSDGTDTYGDGTAYVVGTSGKTLTAIWTADVYVVNFDWQGGSNTSDVVVSQSYTVGTSSPIALPDGSAAARVGLVFQGWATTKGGTALAGETYAPSASITLYALWDSGSFALTYDSLGGSLGAFDTDGSDDGSFVVNNPLGSALKLPTPTRANFTFLGWYAASDSTDKIGDGGSYFVPTADITLYGRWIQDSLYGIDLATLTNPVERTLVAGVAETITVSRAGTTVEIVIPANALPAGTVVSVRVFKNLNRQKQKLPEAEKHAFAMLLSWIDGTGSTATVPDATSDITVTMSNSSFKAGSTSNQIIGGSADADKVETSSVNGQVVARVLVDPEIVVTQSAPDAPTNVAGTALDSAATVTWDAPTSNGGSEIISYTVTASPGGASCDTSATTCNITGLTNGTEYRFFVTATNVNGTSNYSTPSVGVTPTAGADHSLTFDSNGGTSVADDSFASGESVDEPANPSRSGFKFLGWSTSRDDIATKVEFPYTPGVPASISLFALWQESPEVTFDSNGGSEVAPFPFLDGDTIPEPIVPDREGFTFRGWSTTRDDANTAVTFPYTPPAAADLSLFAIWVSTHSVILDSMGGTAVSAPDFAFGNTVPEPTSPTLSGYEFQGWSLVANDSSTQVSFPYEPLIADDLRLSALWSEIFAVTFDSNGGSNVAAGTFAAGGQLAEPDAPSRTGFLFDGWSLVQDLTSTRVDFPYEPDVAENFTLYSLWLAASTARFDSNGGSSIEDAQFPTTGALPAPANPSRTGFTFEGWSTVLDDPTTLVSFPYDPPVDGDVTLYALWDEVTSSSGGNSSNPQDDSETEPDSNSTDGDSGETGGADGSDGDSDDTGGTGDADSGDAGDGPGSSPGSPDTEPSDSTDDTATGSTESSDSEAGGSSESSSGGETGTDEGEGEVSPESSADPDGETNNASGAGEVSDEDPVAESSVSFWWLVPVGLGLGGYFWWFIIAKRRKDEEEEEELEEGQESLS